MAIRVSPTDYRGATRMALIIISATYFIAGGMVSFSMRHLKQTGLHFIIQILVAIVLCNAVIWIFQKIRLPKVDAELARAIAASDGPGFARHIIRREMAKAIQPAGGIAFTLGLLSVVIGLRQLH
jgi:hypothetical protein